MIIKNIQVLRAIAANLVLFSHLFVIEKKYAHGFQLLPEMTRLGAYGVDLFFVISGFIMVIACYDKSWNKFLFSRIIRIFPPYWFYTTLVLAISFISPSMVNASFVSTPNLWKSYLLLPDSSPPLLAVGWTLIYEMYFYICFALITTLTRHFIIPLAYGLVIWGMTISCIRLMGSVQNSPIFTLVCSYLTWEFIGGALIGLYVHKYIIFFPSTTISPAKKLFVLLGDASYSIYLSHVLVLSALGRFYNYLPIHNYYIESLFLILCVVMANIVGLISRKLIEEHLINEVCPLLFLALNLRKIRKI